jgi:hypothetical protein
MVEERALGDTRCGAQLIHRCRAIALLAYQQESGIKQFIFGRCSLFHL